MNKLPPDRGETPTEAVLSGAPMLDALGIEERLAVMNREDAGIAAAVGVAIPAIAAFVRAVSAKSAAGGRLIYAGAGTSGRLGVLDASECPPTFMTEPHEVVGVIAGGDRALRTSSEGLEDDPAGAEAEFERLGVDANDAVLAITAGGTTPYALGAIECAHRRGAYTGLLTCGAVPAPCSADQVIRVVCGAEVVTGSTRMKAGTATKMILNMISTAVMIERGKVYKNLMVDVRASNDKLRDRAARVVSQLTGLGRTDAFALLERAGGKVKPAVVMHARGVSREEADGLLARAGGRLHNVLAESSL